MSLAFNFQRSFPIASPLIAPFVLASLFNPYSILDGLNAFPLLSFSCSLTVNGSVRLTIHIEVVGNLCRSQSISRLDTQFAHSWQSLAPNFSPHLNIMKLDAITLSATTLISAVGASNHRHSHHHPIRQSGDLVHTSRREDSSHSVLEKRKKTCSFPSDGGLVSITPSALNGGWAMSPDQLCEGGGWCPFACPPGQVMAQWNPDSSYTYPSSMDGGLYCNEDGELEVPFPDNPYCVDGSGSVSVVNEAGAPFTFCQTVLPGNEAMLIPTLIETEAVIAVPKSDYWCGTSSHFYINPPGVGEEGCIWGTDTEAIGNWSPFVAGANTASSGETYLKVGWNNEWLHATALNDIEPDYCLSIECDGCNGLPCSICAPEDGINGINAPSSGETADTGSFCVVTIPKGSTAKIVVTGSGSVSTSSVSSASSGGSNNNAQKSNESSTRETSTNDEPSTTSTGDDDEDKDTSTAKKDSETKAKTSSKTTSKSTASSSSKSASSTKSTKVTTAFLTNIFNIKFKSPYLLCICLTFKNSRSTMMEVRKAPCSMNSLRQPVVEYSLP